MKLAVILPAYNEEEAIARVLDDTLAAREYIISNTVLEQVDIIVVDDGSTDRTPDIALGYKEVKLISYRQNRGYGYAIKKGFSETDAELVSFFDVDGTCDPKFLADLTGLIVEKNADLTLGSRLGPASGMPKHRKFLNLILSMIVNFLTGSKMTDMASGMRVIRKSSLEKIYPLPDGLNFTPAMSCKAALDKQISIEEKKMPYFERIGTSKLSVIKDGFYFLKVIFDIVLTYKPIFLFLLISLLLFLASGLYGIDLIKFYLANRQIGNYYHRLSAIIVFILAGTHFIMLGLVMQEAADLVNNCTKKHFIERLLYSLFVKRYLIISALSIAFGIFINREGIKYYISSGLFHIHWLNITVGGLFVLIGIQVGSIGLISRVIELIRKKEEYIMDVEHGD